MSNVLKYSTSSKDKKEKIIKQKFSLTLLLLKLFVAIKQSESARFNIIWFVLPEIVNYDQNIENLSQGKLTVHQLMIRILNNLQSVLICHRLFVGVI